jgi:hypothetical protein
VERHLEAPFHATFSLGYQRLCGTAHTTIARRRIAIPEAGGSPASREQTVCLRSHLFLIHRTDYEYTILRLRGAKDEVDIIKGHRL